MQNNSASRDYFNMEVMKYWSYPSNTKFNKHSKTEMLIKSGAYIGARKVDGEHARYVRQNNKIGIHTNTYYSGRRKDEKIKYNSQKRWL